MDFKIQWFPGHMTKAKRMMEQQLKLVDVVVEMLDARVPRSSTNPMLNQLLGQKPKIIALNKVDMADPAKTEAWKEFKINVRAGMRYRLQYRQRRKTACSRRAESGAACNRQMAEARR